MAILLLIAAIAVFTAATTVFAGIGGSVVPDYPATVIVGQTGIPATLTITNSSTAGNINESVTVSNITHTPSCGSTSNPSTCQAPNIDTGVFTVHNGMGRAGTACAGIVFTASAPDASGKVTFTPSSAVTLGPVSGPLAGAQCIIDFTVDVVAAPTKDASVAPGVQTDQLGSASFLGQTTQINGSGTGSTETTVQRLSPTIKTTLSATSTSIGTSVQDSAMIASSTANAGGTVTYTVYSDSACSTVFANGGTKNVTNSVVPNSDPVIFNAAGMYFWQAVYSGDVSNASATSSCREEIVTVGKNSPTITTLLSASSTTLGGSMHDSSTIAGATANATGTVTYTVYSNNQCSTVFANGGTKNVTNGVVPNSDSVTFNTPGTYYWRAAYSGDLNNNSAVSGCQDEIVTIGKQIPAIATTLSSSNIHVGDTIHDSATLSGATASSSGTVTYTVFSNAACNAGSQNAGTMSVTNGVVPNSNPITFNTAGIFYWQAVYSGDSANAAATSTCTNEVVTVTTSGTTIATTLSAATASTTQSVHDSATLSGATSDAGGTVTYMVYTDASCSAGAQSAGTVNVTNGVVPNSNALTFSTPGTYYWQAVYSGDSKNAGATSPCRSEILTVTAPPTTENGGCEADWKPVGAGWLDFGPIVQLNHGGRLLKGNNPCPLTLPLRFSPGPIKPTTTSATISDITDSPRIRVGRTR